MLKFYQWMEARKMRVLDKASAYSSYNLPKTADQSYTTADQLLKAFEGGQNVPIPVIGDALADEGHPNAVFFQSPEMMAKAHFHLALPSNANNWDDPGHRFFKDYLIKRYRDLFSGKYKPNYRSIKGQQNHGNYVSFIHDLIHNPNRVPQSAHRMEGVGWGQL